jgi:Fe-S-cluster-containing dehydrogenase component/CRP-like cAMP-binding protein
VVSELVGISRPERWDVPFDPKMTDDDVDWLLLLPTFNRIDPNNFLPSLPLRGILRNDCRIRRYENGDIIVRRGDYGNSAFYISEGAVRVVQDERASELPASVLGRVESRKKTLADAFRQLWANPRLPEFRDLRSYVADSRVGTRTAPAQADEVHIFLQDIPGVLGKHKTALLEKGEFFGEIAALGRSPRTATIFSDGPSELLEIRWQGLRDLRRRAPEIKRYIDELYRTRSLVVQLQETPLLRGLSRQDLARVADKTVFETYGDFDWYGSYKTLTDQSAAVRLQQEPVIAEEGHYPNGLVLIRAGFARLSEKHNKGERTVSYLGKGQSYGFEEIVHNWRSDKQVALQRTLRAVGYVDVLMVPTSVMEKIVLPTLAQDQLPPPIRTADTPAPAPKALETDIVPQNMLEFLGDNRFINGTATMMIDLDRCVRCDDCVRACAATHENNPRFLRHGAQHGSYMVANACMQCIDPVCMIGCPTGAIHRSEAQGQVVINDKTCIGCSTCANSCPYDNIRMVEIRDRNGVIVIDTSTNMPVLKATKCDLCIEQLTSPACERACPHDALKRVNMQDLPALARWLKR